MSRKLGVAQPEAIVAVSSALFRRIRHDIPRRKTRPRRFWVPDIWKVSNWSGQSSIVIAQASWQFVAVWWEPSSAAPDFLLFFQSLITMCLCGKVSLSVYVEINSVKFSRLQIIKKI